MRKIITMFGGSDGFIVISFRNKNRWNEYNLHKKRNDERQLMM